MALKRISPGTKSVLQEQPATQGLHQVADRQGGGPSVLRQLRQRSPWSYLTLSSLYRGMTEHFELA